MELGGSAGEINDKLGLFVVLLWRAKTAYTFPPSPILPRIKARCWAEPLERRGHFFMLSPSHTADQLKSYSPYPAHSLVNHLWTIDAWR